MNRVLIIEDDPIMADWLREKITRELGLDGDSIELVETESEFRLTWLEAFDRRQKDKPDCIVIDVMLRWTDPAPKMPPRPADVIEGGHIRAGFRCRKALEEHPELRSVPVLLFTSLTKEDCKKLGFDPDFDSGKTEFVNKDDGQKIGQFIKKALAI